MKREAVTPMFKRIQQWRAEHGRDPHTGAKLSGRRRPQPDVSARHLVVVALRQMARTSRREDLRPVYQELAEMFDSMDDVQGGLYRLESGSETVAVSARGGKVIRLPVAAEEGAGLGAKLFYNGVHVDDMWLKVPLTKCPHCGHKIQE